MAHMTPDEIVARAQRQVADRARQTRERRTDADVAWRYAFGGIFATLAVALIAWPGLPLPWKLYAAVHGVCAQVHNVMLGGVQLPLCARNTGIYSAALGTILVLWVCGRGRAARLPPRGILVTLALAVVVMAVDGLNSLFVDLSWPHPYTPQNWLRTLTGVGAGTALGVLLVFMFNQALRADAERDRAVVGRWRELVGVFVLNALVWLAIYANVAVAYWPVALLSWLGIVGTLFVAMLLPTAVLMGYRRQIRQPFQLARPATVALLVTVAVLALLAVLRFAGEGGAVVF
jgi:uncharacterized membrane protein